MKANRLLIAGAVAALSLVAVYGGGDSAYVGGEINKRFIGIEGSYVGVEGVTLTDPSANTEGGSLGLRLGAQYNEWRAMIVAEFMKGINSDPDYDRVFLQLDYFFLQDMEIETAGTANPYVGLSGGWIRYEPTGMSDTTGFTYGAQAGCTFTLSDKVDLDVGVRYSWVTENEVDGIAAATIGLHYNY